MTSNPETPGPKNPDVEAIKLGIINVPKNQLFPIVLILVLLTSGVAVVVAASDAFRLGGLIAIIIGLGWAALIYQNTQNKRLTDWHESVRDANRRFDITITVLSPDGQPVRGASVTALGPVEFTNRKTNQHGRVVYEYTGQDQINFRNTPVRFTATLDDMTAQDTRELTAQSGQFMELRLKTTQSAPAQQSAKTTAKPMGQRETNMPLDADVYQKVVDFIEPFVADVSSRNALINRTFFNEPVVHEIATAGSASTFAPHIVTVVHNYEGVGAVIRLLETLKQDVGPNRQQEIDALISKLRT